MGESERERERARERARWKSERERYQTTRKERGREADAKRPRDIQKRKVESKGKAMILGSWGSFVSGMPPVTFFCASNNSLL